MPTIVDESGLTCSALMDLMTGEKALVDGTALSIEESTLAVWPVSVCIL